MSVIRRAFTGLILATFFIGMIPASVSAENSISPDLFKEHINRIIWIDWHSGGKSYSTEGTLQTVQPEQNCISLIIRRKFPDEVLKFEGSRILYINLSSIDAFEIRLPE
jgi:hypothetical protein